MENERDQFIKQGHANGKQSRYSIVVRQPTTEKDLPYGNEFAEVIGKDSTGKPLIRVIEYNVTHIDGQRVCTGNAWDNLYELRAKEWDTVAN